MFGAVAEGSSIGLGVVAGGGSVRGIEDGGGGCRVSCIAVCVAGSGGPESGRTSGAQDTMSIPVRKTEKKDRTIAPEAPLVAQASA